MIATNLPAVKVHHSITAAAEIGDIINAPVCNLGILPESVEAYQNPVKPAGACLPIDSGGVVAIWHEPIHPAFPWRYVATTPTTKAVFNLRFNEYRLAFPVGFDPNQSWQIPATDTSEQEDSIDTQAEAQQELTEYLEEQAAAAPSGTRH